MIEIIVKKTNAPKTEIIKKENNIYFLNVAAPPENNKANKEIIKFFSNYFKKRVRIIKGFKTKRKLLKIDLNNIK